MWKPRLRSSDFVRHSSTTPPPDFATARKPVMFTAVGETIVEITDEKLLVRFGSDDVVFTVAVFATAVPAANTLAVTLIVITTLLPLVIEPIVQFTVPLVCVQVPCVLVAEINVTCDGSGSDTVTPCAVAGPSFVTCSVYTSV